MKKEIHQQRTRGEKKERIRTREEGFGINRKKKIHGKRKRVHTHSHACTQTRTHTHARVHEKQSKWDASLRRGGDVKEQLTNAQGHYEWAPIKGLQSALVRRTVFETRSCQNGRDEELAARLLACDCARWLARVASFARTFRILPMWLRRVESQNTLVWVFLSCPVTV